MVTIFNWIDLLLYSNEKMKIGVILMTNLVIILLIVLFEKYNFHIMKRDR